MKQGIGNWTPSRLFIYYAARMVMGTVNSDSGVDNRSMLKALSRYGWCDESIWPYSVGKFRTQPPQSCFDQGAKRTIDQYLSVPQNLQQMQGCLAAGDPFIFGFSVYSSIDLAEKTGIIPLPTRLDQFEGGHDVLFVGYNADTQYQLGIPPRCFKLRNSWGSWGDAGYGYIGFEYAANPNLASDFWTIKHSSYAPPTPPDPIPVPIPPVPPAPGGTMFAYPTDFDVDAAAYLASLLRGATFDFKHATHAAWSLVGYGCGKFIPDAQAMQGVQPLSNAQVADFLNQAIGASGDPLTFSALPIPWSALVTFLLDLLAKWLAGKQGV